MVGRGLKNTTKGVILKYKGQPHVSVWAGETCNRINGTDSSLNPPLPMPVPSLYFFATEFCRSLRMDFAGVSTMGGLTTFRYSMARDIFHPTEPNKCFCEMVMNAQDEDVPNCLKAGLIDMLPCIKGVLYLSLPHFLDGDPELLTYPIVLNPDRERHGTFMDLEPVSEIFVKFLRVLGIFRALGL